MLKDADTSSYESTILQSNLEYEAIINGTQGYILWGIVFVLIACLGCIGNIVTIIVLKRDPIMTTLNILLIALAISDTLAPQANVLLALSFYHLSNVYGDSVNFLIFNDILRHIIQPLSTMFTMTSSWIVTTTTLFRLIAVLWPFKARTLINKRFALLSLLIIFGVSLAAIMPLYASLIRKIRCTRDSKSQYLAFDMEVTSELMEKAYIPTIQTMSFYLPWLIALTLWTFLLRSLRKSERNFNVTFIAKDSNTMATPFLQTNPTQHANSSFLLAVNPTHHGGSKRTSAVESSVCLDGSIKTHNGSILNNTDSRINNAQTRLRSYNRITLMVVVLCFTNLICRVFTFVFIFEVIYNVYFKSDSIETYPANESMPMNVTLNATNPQTLNMARTQFPKFLAYSLLLNNIFLCLNHSCNIVIYTFTNPRFKKNLFLLFNSCFLFRIFSKKCSSTNGPNSGNYNPTNQNHNNINNSSVYSRRLINTAERTLSVNTNNNSNSSRKKVKLTNSEKCLNYLLCFCKFRESNGTGPSGAPMMMIGTKQRRLDHQSTKSRSSSKSAHGGGITIADYLKRNNDLNHSCRL